MMDNLPIKVLFIEDSEVDVELALRAIEKEGFDVSWERVEREDDMRQALTSTPPDMILSDFSMPRFDGTGALQVAVEMVPNIPFIFVSGTIGEERAIEAIRMGATDYVLKSNIRRLGTSVRRALEETAEREQARAVDEERARLVAVLEATSDYVGMYDPQGKIIYLNAAGRRLTGLTESGDVDKTMEDCCPPWTNQVMKSDARPCAEQHGVWQGETAILGADGKEIPVSQVIIAHRQPAGSVRFFSTIARDIRERKAYEARIEHFANYDALTGLPNRNLLGDRATQAIAHARRTGGTAALLVLNVDRFKLVNDSYGHAVGDELLRIVAQRLQALTRESDTVARLGSDSFAILASGLRPDEVLTMVGHIRETLKPAFVLEQGQELHVTVSMGASLYPRDGEEFDVLFRNADAALHRAMSEEHNNFQFYADAMTRVALDRVELENELRVALERGELEVHYQPQITLATGHVIGVEALMRWNHRTRGAISPARFIAVAEESGLICALGKFALVQACRQIAAWDKAGLLALRVAVNVSARQFHSPGFIDMVDTVLREAGVSPKSIEIELTESVLVEDQDKVITILKDLKSIGMQISVDDFGTGYSSLSYLSRLPIDCLKIDQSFVSRIAGDGNDAAIAKAIISLAHALGLRVIAEGVETAGQLEFLGSHHCDEVQGYLFSRPVHPDQIAPLVIAGFRSVRQDVRRQRTE
jgi:diguanylate cyclase (GGDEF)-like protein/PAS domain S-box-containing protein